MLLIRNAKFTLGITFLLITLISLSYSVLANFNVESKSPTSENVRILSEEKIENGTTFHLEITVPQ